MLAGAKHNPDDPDPGLAWVRTWEKAGGELERIRAEELAAMTEEEALRAMHDVFEMWTPTEDPPGPNGLIEQQRLFARFHRMLLEREGRVRIEADQRRFRNLEQ